MASSPSLCAVSATAVARCALCRVQPTSATQCSAVPQEHSRHYVRWLPGMIYNGRHSWSTSRATPLYSRWGWNADDNLRPRHARLVEMTPHAALT